MPDVSASGQRLVTDTRIEQRNRCDLHMLRCTEVSRQTVEKGHEPPRRSLAAVTGLHPIPAAPNLCLGRRLRANRRHSAP